ncbi:hypothetical protein ACFQ0X_12425 [Streptomyces rectiviolaceus]|uniref:Uncharacterized protein n=1 Tax=Streptomyces rectiviolaceus TaxID=332591 RepID=A0ABP6MVR0_9ACTN
MASQRGSGYGGEPDDAVWVADVDYVAAWCAADEAATEVNEAAEALGIDSHLVRAVPHTGIRGESVVWMRPEGVREIAQLLGELAEDRRSG